MRSGRSARLAPALELLDAPGLPPGARVLLLGAAPALAAPLRARSLDPVVVEAAGVSVLPEGGADAAVVVDALERTPWDRWTLQQLHRALKPGGTLVVTAAHMFALAAPDDVIFGAGLVAKQVGLHFARLFGRTGTPRRFTRRKYRPAALRAMLESLGWQVETWRDQGPGLGGRALTPGWTIRARRRPSLIGLDPDRPFPDPVAHRQRFESSRAGFLAIRDRWASAHPSWITPPRPLDLERTRDAHVLVLAPHPDDELIGCGGTVSRLMAHGARVTVLHATDGRDAASLVHAPDQVRRTVRLEEAEAVARAAGYSDVILWREPNDAFKVTDRNVERLRETLAQVRPALIFVPFVTDVHADHVTLARLLARALEGFEGGLPDTTVASYEVWGLVPANIYCDVTAAAAEQERLLWLYPTAMKVEDYVHFCEERNYYNAVALAGHPGFVEAFHLVPAARYPDLVKLAENSR